ncbi:Ig-like domain-containing protein, partial [Acinetobacter sp. ANC 3832]|uniref:Ig-like domain-containing protein n=1 Tax=Acinetobacter sp. ANC 3832 TaxID=1977874 RepID=UPI000B6BA6CB
KGGITNDDTPILNGTSKPNAVVTITDEAGKTVGSATTDANGKWTVELSSQADGPHTYTATAVLDNGTIATDTAKLTIDTTAPTALQIDQVVDDVGTVQGPLKSGDSTDDTTPTISGSKAEPGNLVTINVDGVTVGSAIADKDGHWSYTLPSPGLTEGEHAITATQTDPAGNVSAPSAPFDVVIDITPPTVTATITGITDDTGTVGDFITKDPTLIISGKVSDASQIQAGDKVQVSVDGGKWVDATLKADGTWSYDNTVNPLTEGKHVVEAQIVDKAGNAGAMTSQDVTIDISPPTDGSLTDLKLYDDVAPTVGNITNGDSTDDTTPTYSGKATPDVSVVNVYDNGQLIGSTAVNPDGTWSFTPTTPLTGKEHSFTASPVDNAGNEGKQTDALTFHLLVGAPAEPAILSVYDNAGDIIGPIQKDGATDDKTPTVSGTGEPGTVVHVYSNGVEVGSATVQADKSWSIELNDLGLDGVKNITAKAVNDAGVSSTETGTYPIVLDTTAPATPTFTATDDVAPKVGDIQSGDTTDDSTPTLKGQGEPGDKVTIYDNGQPIGSTTVKADGTWEYTPDKALVDGPHAITATQTDPAGNVSAPSSPLDFTVNTEQVNVQITGFEDNKAPVVGPVAKGGITNDDTPILNGTSKPNAVVTITDEAGKTVGSATTDANGKWTVELSSQADGPHTYTATAVLDNGTIATDTAKLTIDTTAPTALQIDQVVDDVGTVQGPLKSGDSTDDTTPTISGSKAEPGNLVTINVDGVTVGSAIADKDGHWSYTLPSPGLTEGEHAITATQTDPAGNVSAPSAPFDV